MHSNQWRNKRNQLNMTPIPPFNMYSISNYSTDQSKSDLTKTFAEEMLIHNLHMMPNPLQKNLADTMPTAQPPKASKPQFSEPKMEKEKTETRSEYSFSIASFFSGVISAISGGMFQRRREPTTPFHDCFDREPSWRAANRADLNKSQSGDDDAMSADCRAAAAHCEDKLNRVKHLLITKPVPTPPKYRRKPKRLFVEAGSVEESFEDAFSPEDFVRLSNDNSIECTSPINNHSEEVMEAAAQKVKTEVKEVMDIVTTLPEAAIVPEGTQNKTNTVGKTIFDSTIEAKTNEDKETKPNIPNHIETKIATKANSIVPTVEETKDIKGEVIASCEDKVNKLKALLAGRKPKSRLTKESTDSVIEPVKDAKQQYHPKETRTELHDKHFKNPSRTTDKRKKSQLLKNIQEDMCFGNSVETEQVSSPENSPSIQPIKLCDMLNLKEPALTPGPEPEYFDEVHGRFRSTSTSSEDSFQIVFTDSPKATRRRSRTLSDCDSEDSFIVFEDSPDSCYTSHDVFGDTDTDSDSEVSDSGCGSCKISHSLTRTVGDLTDDSLFDDTVRAESGDEVDSVTLCEDLPEFSEDVRDTGLLLNDAKKLLRRQQPSKRVSFSEQPPKVHVMRVWAFAARQARRGTWEQGAVDRDRFKRKIADVDMAVSWVLKPQHRRRIMFQRFMPWWNKQRRLENEEKKRKAEEERVKEEQRKEQERLTEETATADGDNDIEVSDVDKGESLNNTEDGKDSNDSVCNVNGVSTGDIDKNENEDVRREILVTTTKELEELKLESANNVANVIKIDNLNSVDGKTLKKCDFYDKSGNVLSKTNSIDIKTAVSLDT